MGEVDSWHDVPSVDLDVLMQLQRAQDTLLAMEPSISQALALCYLASITLARDAAAELEELAARIAALEEVGK